jgi:hypothetical protein
MSLQPMRLLGFAPLAGIDRLAAAMAAIPGAALQVQRGDEIAALTQVEPHVKMVRRRHKELFEGLHTVQRRLEVACQAGPFLPMDPSAACCPAGAVTRLLAGAHERLAASLAQLGSRHQWDIVLRWSGESVVAQLRDDIAAAAGNRGPEALAEAVAAALRAERMRREAALLAVLTPAMLATAPAAGSETEIGITVLIPANGEAAIESALQRLDGKMFAGASLDMRGPLPPLSFSPVRLALSKASDISAAWRRLDLGDRIDRAGVHRIWRQRAAAAHPDRQSAAAPNDVAELTEAADLLRDILADGNAAPATLPELLARAGYRLVIPAAPAPEAAAPAMVLEAVS